MLAWKPPRLIDGDTDRSLTKGPYSKAEAVYLALKDEILYGLLEPGRLIDKTALCEKLGVSRFPVSAAVSRLAYDRLVDVAPQHGSFVSRISLKEVYERLFIRSALEGEVAAEAARRLGDADVGALFDNLDGAARAGVSEDRADFYSFDVAFHQLLTSRLEMARAGEVLDSLRVHLERVRRLLMSPPGRMREVLNEHGAVADAIRARNPDAARAAMMTHLRLTGALLDAVARQRPEMFSP